MELDEYIAELESKQAAFDTRLKSLYASDLPHRVKIMRINQVTKEIIALKVEVKAAILERQKARAGIIASQN